MLREPAGSLFCCYEFWTVRDPPIRDPSSFDLRLFANLGENFDLVSKHPFFRGASVQLNVENVFNNRPKVRDQDGATPLSYQPDLLEPVGRTIGVTFRKLFIPLRYFQRRQRPGG